MSKSYVLSMSVLYIFEMQEVNGAFLTTLFEAVSAASIPVFVPIISVKLALSSIQ